MVKARYPNSENIGIEAKILVYFRGVYTPVNLTDIAFIYQKYQINWLVTFNKQEYILDRSLNDVHAILHPKQFFKINRSYIVNKDAVRSFSLGNFGKLELKLENNDLKCIVSKDRAKLFRAWFYR